MIIMKNRHFNRRNALCLSLPAVLWLSCSQGLQAQLTTNRYWDPSSGGSFGGINNTTQWVSPLNVVWTGSANGSTTRLQNYSTTLTDICNFGGPMPPATTNTLAGGTVPVGTVNAGWLSFNNIVTTGVTLSGGTITLNSSARIIANNTNSLIHTISSTLAGAATSMSKEGPGTIVLSGNNTFAGPTTVTAGTLTLSSGNALANSPLNTTSSIVGGASGGLRTTVTALTFGGLSGNKDLATLFTTTSGGFNNLNSLNLNPGNAVTTTYTGAISDGAAGMSLIKSGLGTQVLAGANTHTGSTTLNAGTLRLDYGTQDNSKLSDAGALVLGNGVLELTGGSHVEVVSSTTLTGNTSIIRSSGTAVIALGAVTGSGSIDFSADNIATTTTANNALGILPFATIGGGNLAANDGNGNIVTFNGYADIDARGPSTIPDNVNALVRIVGDGTSGNISLSSPTTSIFNLLQSNASFSATIDTAARTFATTAISVGSSAESLNVGAVAGDGILRALDAGGTLVLTSANSTKSLTINASVADNTSASAVSTAGAGTVVLAGANTHTGATTAGDGTLVLSGSLSGSAVSVVGDAVLNQSPTGQISGTITVTHNSSGTSILAGTNSYTGATNINSGNLNIQNGSALGDTSVGTTVASGAALQIQNEIAVGTEPLTLNGSGSAGTGAIRNISGTNTYGGPVTLAGPTVIGSEAGTLTLSHPGSITGSTFPLTVRGAGNTVIESSIDTTSGSLDKQGSGTLTLKGSNTYSGSISVTAGVLNLQNNTAAGTTAGGVGVASGAALQLQGGIIVGNEALNLVGTGVSNTGALRNISGENTWGGLISLSVNTRIHSDAGTLILDVPSGNAISGTGVSTSTSSNVNMTFGGNGNFTVADPITSGTLGTGVLTKEGAGTLVLQAANTHTGPTVVSAGLISLGNVLALQNSPLDTTASVMGDATNGLRTTVTTLSIGGLIGNKNLADVFTTSSGGYESVTALTLNPSLARSFSGAIADGAVGMTLTKSGVAVQTLSGALNHTGATSIIGGTLKLDGGAVIPSTPIITLGSGTGLDLSTLGNPLGLGSGQTLRSSATGANLTGTLTTALAKDLILSAGGLVFSAYGGANGISATNAPLTITGTTGGELKLNGAPVTVNTTSVLPIGTYVLVAKGGNATVTGTPGPLTVTGSGVNGTATLAVSGDQLVLTVAAGGYVSWQSTNNAPGAIDLDHDGDSVPNGVEYFLGGPNGNTTGFTALPSVVASSGTLSITWLKGSGYLGNYGTDFVVETSATLSGVWTTETIPGGNIVNDPGFVKFTFPGGPAYSGKNFARLRVAGP